MFSLSPCIIFQAILESQPFSPCQYFGSTGHLQGFSSAWSWFSLASSLQGWQSHLLLWAFTEQGSKSKFYLMQYVCWWGWLSQLSFYCSLLLDMVVSRTLIKIILHFLPVADLSWDTAEFFSNSHVLLFLVWFVFCLERGFFVCCFLNLILFLFFNKIWNRNIFYSFKGMEGKITDLITSSPLLPFLRISRAVLTDTIYS